MNKVFLMGRLTKDIDLKYTNTGKAYLKNTIAVNDEFNKEKTDFLNIMCWDKTAENIARFFQKGNMILIIGRISTGSYEKEGKKIYTTDIIVDKFYFTGEKKNNIDQGPNIDNGFFPLDEMETLPF
jgi:single-strand DNA-binding protein